MKTKYFVLRDVIEPQEETAEIATNPHDVYSSDVDILNLYVDKEYPTIDEVEEVIKKEIGKPIARSEINNMCFQFQMKNLRTIGVEVNPYRLIIRRID